MKKILILSFYHPPDVTPGAFRIKSLLDQLSKQRDDIEVTVITTKPNRYTSFNKSNTSDQLEIKYPPYLRIHKIEVPQNNNKLILQVWGFIIYASKAFSIARKSNWDLVFSTSSRLMTAFLSAIIAYYKNTKLFLDIRDLFSDTAKHVFSGIGFNVIYPFIKYIEAWTFRKAAIINLVSPGFKKYVSDINPNARITEYTNGIDQVFMDSNFERKVTEEKRLKILYAGNIGPSQNLESILPNFAKKVESIADLQIIGNGGSKKELQKKLINLDCKNVELIDHVLRIELLKKYNEADILFLNLADLDCFKKVLPSKIFEYGSTGKPILAGVSGFAKDFLIENVPSAYIFYPSNLELCLKSFNVIRKNYKTFDSSNFKNKFSRNKISKMLADEILDFTNLNEKN